MKNTGYMSSRLHKIFNGIDDEGCYIIAEIGSNFNGSLDLAKDSIDAAVNSGADAVKFQTFKAEEFVADKNLTYSYYNSKGKRVTESQYEMFKRLELKDEWHKILNEYAKERGVDFISSAADKDAVDLLISLDVPGVKLASEDLINIKLLDHLAKKRYPTILSTGMANRFEIENALDVFDKYDSDRLIILHCISQYPTPLQNANLKRISEIKDHFGFPVGFSDHTEGWEAPMLSIGFGAKVIEKHFTLDKNLPGPDHKMAADPTDFKKMVEMIRLAEKMAGEKTLDYHEDEEKPRIEFRRSIVANQFIPKGTVITESMLAFKRPGDGLKPYQINEIKGRKAKHDIKKNNKLLVEDVG